MAVFRHLHQIPFKVDLSGTGLAKELVGQVDSEMGDALVGVFQYPVMVIGGNDDQFVGLGLIELIVDQKFRKSFLDENELPVFVAVDGRKP